MDKEALEMLKRAAKVFHMQYEGNIDDTAYARYLEYEKFIQKYEPEWKARYGFLEWEREFPI